MKAKKILLALSALALASCTHAQTSNSTSGASSASTTPVSDSTSTAPSTSASASTSTSTSTAPVIEEYYIIVPSDVRYTVTVKDGLTKATAKTKVTFTVTASAGFGIAKVYVDSTEVTGTDGTYTITMPDHDIRITVALSVEGDMTIQGDIAAVLTKGEDGIYSAKGIQVDATSSFSYFITASGKTTELDSSYVDRTKCFAGVTFAYKKDYKLEIVGGAKYDFFYDPSSKLPCYIQRTEITALPNSADTLENLFTYSNGIMSEPTIYAPNLNHVEYTSTRSDISYTWDKYTDNRSLGKAVSLTKMTSTPKVVYKEIKDGVYSVVDTYDEANDEESAIGAPTIVTEDSKAFSGRYKIADVNPSRGDNTDTDVYDVDYSSEFMNSIIANFDVNRASHDMNAVEYDIDSAYRVQMTVADEVTYAKCAIASKANTDGGFTTTITSDRVYDESAVAADASTLKYYDKYAVTLTFTKAGALLSGSYKDTRFAGTNFNLASGVVTTTGNGETYSEVHFAYTYGAAKDLLQDFDKTPYFITSIAPVLKDKKVVNTPDNQVATGANIEEGHTLNSDIVSLNALPATALDSWQYHVVSSSDASIIGWDNTYRNFTAFKAGTVNLTFANFATGDVTKVVSVTAVMTYKVREFSIVSPIGSGLDIPNANSAFAYSGESTTYELYTMADAQDPNGNGISGNQIPPSDLTFTLSDTTTGLVVSYVPKGVYNSTITFDATACNVAKDMTLTMTINSSYYGTGDTPTKVTVYLYAKGYTIDVIKGTSWSYTAAAPTDVTVGVTSAVCNFTTTAATTEDGLTATQLTTYTNKGNLIVTWSNATSVTYNFAYGFDKHTYMIPAKVLNSDHSYSYTMSMGYTNDSKGEVVQICLFYEETAAGKDGTMTNQITQILGDYAEDEGDVTYYYNDFSKVIA
jgi:hypothetical protein